VPLHSMVYPILRMDGSIDRSNLLPLSVFRRLLFPLIIETSFSLGVFLAPLDVDIFDSWRFTTIVVGLVTACCVLEEH